MGRKKKQRRRLSGGPCDLHLTAREIGLLVAIRDAGEIEDRALDDRPTLGRLHARGLVWRTAGSCGLTWGGMGWCGRILEPEGGVH